MRRRDAIALIGAAAVRPLTVHAQQAMRRIGVLVAYAEGDPEMQARLAAFRQGLEQLGWSEGRNVSIDIRFAPAGAGQEQTRAREIVAVDPDVILHIPLRSSPPCSERAAPSQSSLSESPTQSVPDSRRA